MPSQNTEGSGLSAAILTALIVAVLLIALTPATMLWDQDEGFYARTVVEMLETRNWLIPTYNGELFAHKPPLIFWLMAISMSIFGETEFASRLPSALALSGASFMTFLIGRRIFDATTGWWAMIILPTTVLGAYLGSAAMLDALLVFCICLTLWAYVEMTWRPETTWPMMLVFGIGMYLALLTKGPVGPAVIVTTVAASWLLLPSSQRVPFRHGVALVAATLTAFALFLMWVVPANMSTDGDLLEQGLGVHIIGRALVAMEGHGGTGFWGYVSNLPYYVPVLLLGFLPWTLHMPATFQALWSGLIGDRRTRVFLWSWIVPTLLMFTIAATKLPHYIFPMFPAMAIATAATLVRASKSALDEKQLFWFRIGGWLYLVCGIAGALALLAAPFFISAFFGWPIAIASAVLLLIGFFIVGKQQLAGKTLAASRLAATTAPLAIFGLIWVLAPQIEPLIKAQKHFGEVIAEHATPETRVFSQSYTEPSFIFYADRPFGNPIIRVAESQDGIDRVLVEKNEVIFVTTKEWLPVLNAQAGNRPFRVIAEYAAYNINRGMIFQELVVTIRKVSAP